MADYFSAEKIRTFKIREASLPYVQHAGSISYSCLNILYADLRFVGVGPVGIVLEPWLVKIVAYPAEKIDKTAFVEWHLAIS
jgi:hypothetical protein